MKSTVNKAQNMLIVSSLSEKKKKKKESIMDMIQNYIWQ